MVGCDGSTIGQKYLLPLNPAFKKSQDGKFCVLCILPQWKKKKKSAYEQQHQKTKALLKHDTFQESDQSQQQGSQHFPYILPRLHSIAL